MELHFRQIEVDDAEAIAGLSGQLGYPASALQMENRIKHILRNKDHCTFAAILDGELIGWVHGFHAIRIESAPFVEIGGLVVDENFRRKGIGQQLVEKVKDWAVGKYCNKLRVRSNTVRTDTHEFYKGISFRETKEQKIFDRVINPI